jgi:hypothetical protein
VPDAKPRLVHHPLQLLGGDKKIRHALIAP